MISKKTPSEWHPCGNYHVLDSATKYNFYPIPFLLDLFVSLCGKTIFSKLDLARAYHQIPVHQVDVPKTVVVNPEKCVIDASQVEFLGFIVNAQCTTPERKKA